MKRLSLQLLLLCAVLFFSCKKYDKFGKEIKYLELYKANWLLGEWEKNDSLGVLKEIWTTLDDSTYKAKSYYIINKKDTVHNETIELMQEGEFLIYRAKVMGQNNNQSIPFQLIKDSDSLLVFENKKHEYPQKIEYQLQKNNVLTAKISGKHNGKTSSESYPMKKIK